MSKQQELAEEDYYRLGEFLSDNPEFVGGLLRESAECNRRSKALEEKVDALALEVHSLRDLGAEQRGANKVRKWLVNIFLPLAVTASSWGLLELWRQDRDLARLQTEVVAAKDILQRHERAHGHEGSRSEVSSIRRDISALQTSMTNLEYEVRSNVEGTRSDIQELRRILVRWNRVE